MQKTLDRIDGLLAQKAPKKADVLIAKLLRSKLSPSDQAALLLRRARVRLINARPEDALDDLTAAQTILGENFQTPANLEVLGDCYFARFELASVGFSDKSFLQQAYQTYEQIVVNFPRYGNLGWIYYQLGRVDIANDQIERAVECFQQALLVSTHVTALTAYCYERLGFIAFYEWRDLDKALGFLNRAVDTYPATEDRTWLIQVHLRRSRVLRQMHDQQAALAAAETALSLVSGNHIALAEVQLAIAELLATIGRRDREVIACLHQFTQNTKRPLGVDVTWSRANEMLGDAYFNLGQYDNAILAYRSALQFNPDHPWELSLLSRIARCYYQQRGYQTVVDVIHSLFAAAQADEQPVDDYRIYDMLGSAQFALGKYVQATEAYQRALELAPAHADLQQIKTYLDYARERI